MLKFSSLLSITVLCAVIAACQPGESPEKKSATETKTAQQNPAVASSEISHVPPISLTIPLVNSDNLAEAIRLAGQALAVGNYQSDNQNQPAALEWYIAILRFNPANAEAQTGIKNTIDALLQKTSDANRAGKLDLAARLLQVIELSEYPHPEITRVKSELDQAKQANVWAQKGLALEKESLVLPKSGKDGAENAVYAYRKALEAFPEYQPALMAIARLRTQREIAAMTLAKQQKFEAALIALKQAELVDDKNPQFQQVSNHVLGRLNQAIQEKIVLANLALDGMRIEVAEDFYRQAEKILPTHPEVILLAQRIDDTKHYSRFKPRQIFSDAWAMSSPSPEMVVIPYGQFEMGAPSDLSAASAAEKPQHKVIFKRGFAMARNETTVGQFRQFIESTGYQTRAAKLGWSMIFDEKGGSMTKRANVDWRHDHLGRLAKDDLPVVHVNLADAEAYARWLSDKTGAAYRLPSEAEFEYVLKAGSGAVYPWGENAPSSVVANLAGAGDKSTKSRSWGNAIPNYRDFYWGAAPVRSFPRERWGTFDASGNVEEWVQDCWHDSYQRAPSDGSAWTNPGCKTGVTRGASWASSLNEARVGFRKATLMKSHNARIGFRVVRAL